MKYIPKYNAFVVTQQELQMGSDAILYAMRKYRQALKLPIGKRKHDGPLEDYDHAERAIIEGLKSLGIDLGVEWGEQLDLTDQDT
jgi:hypothetical protein